MQGKALRSCYYCYFSLYLAADKGHLAGDVGECFHVRVHRRRGYTTVATTSTITNIATAVVVADIGLRPGRGLERADRLHQPERSGMRALRLAGRGLSEAGTTVYAT